MKIDSKFFKLIVCAGLLSASTFACTQPGQNTASTSTPAAVAQTPTGGAAPDAPSVSYEVTQVEEGKGEAVGDAGAVLVAVQVWGDAINGQQAMSQGATDLLLSPESQQMPGLWKAAKDMKVGGKIHLQATAKDLFGELPSGAQMNPNKPLYIEMAAKEIFPKEEFKFDTTKAGSGDKAAADGDVLKLHYVGRTDNPKDGKVFDSSRERDEPFILELGSGSVIPGWELGLQGIKKGEIRQLSIPHYLAYGVKGQGSIPPKSRLFFEVEALDFVVPGEFTSEVVKQGRGDAIASGQKGTFHYTGWTNGFEGKKFDSSKDRDKPFEVTLGQGMVIEGWDKGLVGMRPGEVRRLTIPYNQAYGESGRPPQIPPYATLYFEVEFLGLAPEPTPAPAPPNSVPQPEATPTGK